MFRAPMRRCIAFVVASVQRQENFGSLFSGKLRLRDTRNRATRNPDCFASDRLDLFLNFVRFCHPSSIKVEGALCHAAASVSGCVKQQAGMVSRADWQWGISQRSHRLQAGQTMETLPPTQLSQCEIYQVSGS